MQGWQEREQYRQRGLALMLYRWGMYFVPAEKHNPPEVYELFNFLWSDEEIMEMKVARIKANMIKRAATPVRRSEK